MRLASCKGCEEAPTFKRMVLKSCRGCPYTVGTIANGCLTVFYDVCGVFGALTAVCGSVNKTPP